MSGLRAITCKVTCSVPEGTSSLLQKSARSLVRSVVKVALAVSLCLMCAAASSVGLGGLEGARRDHPPPAGGAGSRKRDFAEGYSKGEY